MTRKRLRLCAGFVCFAAVRAFGPPALPSVPERTRATRRSVAALSSSPDEFAPSATGGGSTGAAAQAAAYLESLSNALNEQDLEQLAVEERLEARQRRRQAGKFAVTLPVRDLGITLVQVLPGRRLAPRQLDLDAVDRLDPLDGAARAALEDSLTPQLDPGFRGLVVATVRANSPAAGRGIRPGTVLTAVSATLGDAVWPKSSLEGVQAAVRSRRSAASEVTLLCTDAAAGGAPAASAAAGDRYELDLTKPIGLLLAEQDGAVVVTGLTAQASTLVRFAVRAGDRVVAVDSAMGGKLWPVSTVEGVISACTGRLPGQTIRIVLERPLAVAESYPTVLAADGAAVGTGAVSAPSVPSPAVDQAKLLRQCRQVLRKYSNARGSRIDKYNLPAMVADKVVDALASASASVDPVTLSMIMSAYLSCEQPLGALKAFEAATGFAADASTNPVLDPLQGRDGNTMVPSEAALDLLTASALMQAHARNDDLDSVLRVLAALEGRSGVAFGGDESAPWPWTGAYGTIQPDNTCYNIAIAAAERIGGYEALEAALEVFGRMPRKDVVTYNTIISALSNTGEFEKAFQTFAEIKRSGIQPDKFTYTALLKACVMDEDVDEIMYDMRERGVEADVETYNTVLRRLCERRQFTPATRLVTEMESRGIPPNSMTYGMIMSAMVKAKKANACLALFESASANPRTVALTENVHLYTTAIAAASTLGDYERALEIVSKMNGKGIAPNLKTMTALMGACLASGQAPLAVQIFQQMKNPDGYAMTKGIEALCAAGKFEEASQQIQRQRPNSLMSGKQIMKSYSVILESALRANAFDVARETVKDFLHKGFIFDKTFLRTLDDILATPDEAGDMDKFSFCLFVIDSLRQRNLPIEGSLYSVTLLLGRRLGGLPRQLASLMAQSKTAVGARLRRSPPVAAEAGDAAAGRRLGLQDLLALPELLDQPLVLPPLPVRVAPTQVRAVLRAEQLVWSQSDRRRRRRRVLV